MPRGLQLAFAVALCCGCEEETPAAPTTDTVVTSAPLQVDSYPHYILDGRRCWLVGDRWYTRDGNNWVLYLNEPEELVRARQRMMAADLH